MLFACIWFEFQGNLSQHKVVIIQLQDLQACALKVFKACPVVPRTAEPTSAAMKNDDEETTVPTTPNNPEA